DAGALGERPHRTDEIDAARDGAAVHVGGPKDRLAAVDKEAARRRAMSDDALGTHAKSGVRGLLVGSDPAVRVARPGELGEGLVEALDEGRQHRLGIEVARACRVPSDLVRQKPSSARKRSRAVAAISPWRKPSRGAAKRSRSRISGGRRVENGASTT